MTRLAKIAKGLGALALLAALVGGIPFALWHFVGWPLPHRLPSWSGLGHDLNERGIPDRTLIDALAVAVWLTWAVLVASLVAEIPAAIRGQRARRLPLAGTFQPLTGRLVAALVVAMLAVSPRPTHASGASFDTRPVAAVVLTDATALAPTAPFRAGVRAASGDEARAVADGHEPGARGASAPVPAAHGGDPTYVVRRGDTLWGIAQRELGDPLRWSDIYRLNAGRPQPGGRVLSDPHWIDPGWTLLLPPSPGAVPVGAAPSSVASGPAPTTATGPPVTTEPRTSESTPTAPPPTLAPPSPPARPAPTRGTSAPAVHHEEGRGSAPAAPVRLPSGSIVGGSFALGVLGALALGRRRRRHAYRYRPPLPGRRLDAEPLGPTLHALADALAAPSDDPDAEPIVVSAAPADAELDHRESPDLVEVGSDERGVQLVLLTDLAGICFVGNDADSVVRSLVCSLLTRSGPIAAEVLATAAAFERLFPGMAERAAQGEVPGVRIVQSDEAIRALLEAEVDSRTCQFALDGVSDVLAYRQTYPWDPTPTVIALVDQVGESEAERWQAVFDNGARLGLGAIVLKPTENGERRVELGPDGTATVVSDVAWSRLVDGVRCFALQPNEAAEIFSALAAADERPTSEEPATDRVPRLVEDGAIDGVTESEAQGEPWPEVPDIEPQSPDVAAPITVRVFGPYEIAVNGRVIDKGLRTVARELLAWYLLRPEGASRGAVVEACWPDTEPAAVSNTFWRPVGDLRRLVGAVADPPTKLLDATGGDVYRLDTAAIDCDLWRFQAALAAAVRAENHEDARRALREVIDCYRGEFLEGADYFWVEPVREDLHRRALDAHLRLAELEEALGNPDGAEAALDAATEFDRYAEEPYRRLMTLQAERGRLDAAAATWRQLERRLAEIDVDPEPTTLRLYRSLIATRESIDNERLRRTS